MNNQDEECRKPNQITVESGKPKEKPVKREYIFRTDRCIVDPNRDQDQETRQW